MTQTLRRRATCALLAAIVAGLALAPAARAESIFADCADGRLDARYSPSEIRNARQNIPTDVDEYTDCRDVLTSALDDSLGEQRGGGGDGGAAGGGAGDGGTGGGGGGASPAGAPPASPPAATGAGAGAGGVLTPASPEEQRALAEARSGAGPTALGRGQVVPGAAGLTGDAARQDIPAPLLVVLVLLGVLVLAGAAATLSARVTDRLESG